MFDGKAFGQEIVGVVKAHMERSLAPIVARLDAVEKRFDDIVEADDLGGVIRDIATLRVEVAKSADVADIKEAVAEAVAALPQPENGKDGVNGADGRDGIDGKDGLPGDRGEKGEAGSDGHDGVGLAGALIDRSGGLVLTLTDGSTRDLGPVVGKDGAPGEKGADGLDGRHGVDGVGFDDLDMVETDEGVFLRCVRGEVVKQWRLPIVIDRGVFKEGHSYRKGDGVTWGGSFWIAQGDAVDKPDSGKGWRLAVKKGRDGKDGTLKDPPKPGPVKVA